MNTRSNWCALAVLCGAAWACHAAEDSTPPPPTAAPAPQAFTFTHTAMGAKFEIQVYPPTPGMLEEELRPVVEEAWEAIDALERRISNWIPESELSQVNRQAAVRSVPVSSATLLMLDQSRQFWEQTGGAFDPTVGPLIELWGFYRKEGHLPSDDELEQARAKVGLQYVEVDYQASTVKFKKSGMHLDFGGIGKGYAVDLAAGILKGHGVTAALVNGGNSSLYAIGHPPERKGWTVRLQQSYGTAQEYVQEIEITDVSFSASSGVEKFFELEGNRYCHIFDPKTGMPVEGVLTAMVVAPTATETDALSTSFFVLGETGTRAYCEKHPEARAILMVPGPNGTVETKRINFK
ncbi:MAG: FAD:protein FMN transferase [Candidatus Hydrogenedentes bacterium]|nr:FAD:protein FMN transferase [Candidatus Hydrogenedentota bacterium]